MRACSHTRVERDPADAAPHDLGDHASVVAVAGHTQAVEVLGCDINGGIEAERVVRGVEVVIHCFRDADHGDAGLCEAIGREQCSVATDSDEGVHIVVLENFAHTLGAPSVLVKGVDARGAEDRSALTADAAHKAPRDRDEFVVAYSLPAVEIAHEFIFVNGISLEDCSADDRVESRAVAARSQNADLHATLLRLCLAPRPS